MRFENGICGFNQAGSSAIINTDFCSVASFGNDIPSIKQLIDGGGKGEVSVTSSVSGKLLVHVTSTVKSPAISPHSLFHNSNIIGFRWNKKFFGERYINIAPKNEEPFFVVPVDFLKPVGNPMLY